MARTAADAGDSPGETGTFCLKRTGRQDGFAPRMTNTPIGYEEKPPHPPPLVYENHSQDTRYTGPLETAQTVLSTFGRRNNQPFCSGDAEDTKIRPAVRAVARVR